MDSYGGGTEDGKEQTDLRDTVEEELARDLAATCNHYQYSLRKKNVTHKDRITTFCGMNVRLSAA